MMLAGTIDAAKINVINIDASKITTGTLTAVEMHQNGGGADTWINKDGIHNQMGNSNVWIKRGTLAAFDSSGQGMYMESGQLTLASSAYWQNGLKLESINYGVIKCDDDITGKKESESLARAGLIYVLTIAHWTDGPEMNFGVVLKPELELSAPMTANCFLEALSLFLSKAVGVSKTVAVITTLRLYRSVGR